MDDKEIKLYKIMGKYIKTLRDESKGGDSSLYEENKSERPYIGVELNNGQKYYIPITKAKERLKYLTAKELDFIPIYKNGKMVAGIEFNKMIPAPDNQVRDYNLKLYNKVVRGNRENNKELAQYEDEWCKKHSHEISEKAQKLHDDYTKDRLSSNIRKRCVNFTVLEKLCQEYAKEHPSIHEHKKKRDDNNRKGPGGGISSRIKARNKRSKNYNKKKRNINRVHNIALKTIKQFRKAFDDLIKKCELIDVKIEKNQKKITESLLNEKDVKQIQFAR